MPCAICSGQAMHLCAPLPPEKLNRLHHVALLTRSWQYTTYAAICNMKRFALLGLMHPHRDACVQTVLTRPCIYVPPCAVLPSVPLPPERPNGLHHAMLRYLGDGNAPQTPRQQLKPSGLMHAPKRPYLCAICAGQAMHLRVLLPTQRVNRLHHAKLWCLGAGNASHTQLYVT